MDWRKKRSFALPAMAKAGTIISLLVSALPARGGVR